MVVTGSPRSRPLPSRRTRRRRRRPPPDSSGDGTTLRMVRRSYSARRGGATAHRRAEKEDPMKWRSLFLALATAAAATLVSGQEVSIKQTAIESSDNPRLVTITGEVVRFEPGQTIVLRASGKETTYTLSPSATLPSDLQIGKN